MVQSSRMVSMQGEGAAGARQEGGGADSFGWLVACPEVLQCRASVFRLSPHFSHSACPALFQNHGSLANQTPRKTKESAISGKQGDRHGRSTRSRRENGLSSIEAEDLCKRSMLDNCQCKKRHGQDGWDAMNVYWRIIRQHK